jgi:FixJ family two-component response regulator
MRVRYRSCAYSSAEAFLEDSKHPQFDCLLLDIQLTGISGIELKTRLNFADSKTPVIFITAHDDPEARWQAITAVPAFFERRIPAVKFSKAFVARLPVGRTRAKEGDSVHEDQTPKP